MHILHVYDSGLEQTIVDGSLKCIVVVHGVGYK